MQDWCRTWKMERLRESSLPVRGEIGKAISEGKLKGLAVMRSRMAAEFGQSKQEKYNLILHLSEHRRVMIMETVVVSVERRTAECCPMRW